jgi:hypothetical protein
MSLSWLKCDVTFCNIPHALVCRNVIPLQWNYHWNADKGLKSRQSQSAILLWWVEQSPWQQSDCSRTMAMLRLSQLGFLWRFEQLLKPLPRFNVTRNSCPQFACCITSVLRTTFTWHLALIRQHSNICYSAYCNSNLPWRRMGTGGIAPPFLPSTLGGVANFMPRPLYLLGEEYLVFTGQEAAWAPKPVWTLWRG